jgi:hypothetical protein
MKRAEVTARLPLVFGLDRLEAAAAVGISATLFDALVVAGTMPQPRTISTRRVWDVDELRAAFKALPKTGDSPRKGDAESWDDVA